MQENNINNNALEKAENVAEQVKNENARSRRRERRAKSLQNAKARLKEERLLEREQQRQMKKDSRLRAKEEREKILAERRIELARIKAHKKAERQKAKATALREKNRKRAELKAQKAALKAQKEERKALLKNETKVERQRRLSMERKAKEDRKIMMRAAKEERKAKVAQEKRIRREQKSRERQRRRKSNKGVGGWIAAVVSLGIATLVLASVLTFTFLMPTTSDNMLESGYRKSFYDTVEQVDNIDVNLAKIMATKDTGAMQKYLVDTAINSELAENDVQQLPLHDESKYYTTKLINQIGDYAKYLNNKIIDGQSLTESDIAGLNQLYRANLALKNSLQKTISNMADDYSFTALLDGGDGDIIISNFNELQNLSVEYPELIYDGPFSDGQVNRQLKGLIGAEISAEQAKEQFNKLFASYGLENVTLAGEAGGNIACYNVQGEKDGDVLFAQFSKTGGKLIQFSYAGDCNQVRIDDDVAIETAQDFMSQTGITGMKPVWINLTGNVYTINFAFDMDGVIVYSDLVKVRVCADTNTVLGLEASGYYTNHVERVIETPVLSEQQACEKVSDNIDIDTIRLAIVPIGTKSEKLCFEISGEYDGSTYYVYVDAITGRQVEMFKVIESTEGTLLL